jgi:hypothetical protein
MFFAVHILNLEVFPQQPMSLSISDAILADVFVNAGDGQTPPRTTTNFFWALTTQFC